MSRYASAPCPFRRRFYLTQRVTPSPLSKSLSKSVSGSESESGSKTIAIPISIRTRPRSRARSRASCNEYGYGNSDRRSAGGAACARRMESLQFRRSAAGKRKPMQGAESRMRPYAGLALRSPVAEKHPKGGRVPPRAAAGGAIHFTAPPGVGKKPGRRGEAVRTRSSPAPERAPAALPGRRPSSRRPIRSWRVA